MADAPAPDGAFCGFDLHTAESRAQAACLWAQMRAAPALPHGEKYGGFYIVSKYAELMQVLLKPDLYRSGDGITLPPAAALRTPHIPAEIDQPMHREYRALLAKFLTPEKVNLWEPEIRRLVAGLLDGFKNETKIDIVARLARPLPVYAALALIGLPAADAPFLDELVVDLHHEVASGTKTGAAEKLTRYVETALLRHREIAADPDEGILSSVVLGQVNGRALTLEEQISTIRLLLIGGFDTTAIALATFIWWLAQHPQDTAALRANPALIGSASEDVVRFASPATYLTRTVTRDVSLGGRALRAGDRLLLAFGAANRDPAKFDRAEEIVLDRIPVQHLGFGAGIHRCIGSFFAKLELRVALDELLRRYEGFALDPALPPEMAGGLNQGFMSLPVILTPRAA